MRPKSLDNEYPGTNGIAGMIVTLIAYILYKETKGTVFEKEVV
ncbi:MAG: hypothetical protein QXP59_07445 [Saccharolobus sp.]